MPGQPIIQMMCPKLTCRRVLAVPGTARGKLVRCRGCGSTIRVPSARIVATEVESDPTDEQDDTNSKVA